MLCARIFYQCMILFRRLPLFSFRAKKNADRFAKESIGISRMIMQAEQTHLDVRTVSSQPSIVSSTRRLFPH